MTVASRRTGNNPQDRNRQACKALDRSGEPYEMEAEGLLAVCIQHECDHLNGKLFVDHLSGLKRSRIKSKLTKQKRVEATS